MSLCVVASLISDFLVLLQVTDDLIEEELVLLDEYDLEPVVENLDDP